MTVAAGAEGAFRTLAVGGAHGVELAAGTLEGGLSAGLVVATVLHAGEDVSKFVEVAHAMSFLVGAVFLVPRI